MKKILFILTCFFFFLIPNNILAETVHVLPYTIDKYHIDIKVNENNVFDIVEEIDVDFNVSKHGIYRYIPLKNNVTRVDGTTSVINAKLKNIYVSDEYSSYISNSNRVLQIGSPDITLTGEKKYVIKYSYDLGRDKNKEFDELYFNIIGTGWDTTISNFTFTIHMPKEYDKEKFGISLGQYGTSGTDSVSIEFIDNDINGKVLRDIEPGEALTTRIELVDGYFVREFFNDIEIGLIILSLSLVVFGVGLWKLYGDDPDVIETVEFYPPNDLNSAEVGYIYNGEADDKSVVSLLIYLASKGYIKIKEEKNNITFYKNKPYDGKNIYEKIFYSELFRKGDSVTLSSLIEKFYTSIATIKYGLSKSRDKYFHKKSDNKRFLIVIAILVISIFSIINFYNEGEILSIIISVGLIIISLLLFKKNKKKRKKVVDLENVIGIVCLIIIGSLLLYLSRDYLMMLGFYTEVSSLVIILINFISIILLEICFKYLPKKNEYGNMLMGKIKGFRNFLELAGKSKLEELVMEDPEYFYNILPFTYALGISDKWIKKFEDIAIVPPEWYDVSVDTSNSNRRDFNDRIDRMMNKSTRAMISVPEPVSTSGSNWDGGS